jgi:quinol monooxygenase YgiN
LQLEEEEFSAKPSRFTFFAEWRVYVIIVRITLNALLEKRTEVKQTLLSMIGPTENESGCLSCHLSRDIEDRNVFNLIEESETRENMVKHLK